MIAASPSQSLNLRHQPYGERHPYIPLPFERSPRDPVAGEPVLLNIETGLTPPAKEVWCAWWVDGNPVENRLQASRRTGSETADQWQVVLPAFTGYEVVHYRLFARSDGQQVESEEFTFSVSSWEKVVSVVKLEQGPRWFEVTLATNRKDLHVRLRAELNSTETFSLHLSTIDKPGDIPSEPAIMDPILADWENQCVSLSVNPLRLELSRKGDGLALRSVNPIQVLVNAIGTVQQYRIGFESPDEEAFYGFGERFNALDQRGNHLDNYVYGQYTSQGKRSYIPIPFFISSRGYGFWLQTDQQAEFDLAANETDRWTLTGNAEDNQAGLEMKFFFQDHPHAIVQAFTNLTGKSKLPPSWVFGLWMSSNDWNTQTEVISQLHETERQNIPATVLVIEAWSDEINFYIWNDAQYPQKASSQALTLNDYTFPPEGHWPDPKAMIDELHQAGLRIVLWQNPAIKQAEPRENLDEALNKVDQDYAIEQGFVVTKADGSPHRVEPHMPWFRGSLVLDFTNQKAAEWWLKKREYLVTEMNVDGFKTDGGEHIWDTETRFSNNLRGTREINIYPVVYENAYRRFMEARRGQDYVLFSRAGYSGAQQNPCHWAGDENSTWEAFRASLRAMLNAGLCGIPFMGWDIAGFCGPIPSSELYLRAAAFSALCPIMQYHSDVNAHRLPSRDRTPWNIQEQTGDTSVIPIFRKFVYFRMNLLPYILNQARESSLTGLPLMRALPLEYPSDTVCRKYPYEYLFGEALLVAPIMAEGISTWPVYLPEGEWRELWTGEFHRGPAVVEVNAPRDRIPVFQKKGSLMALNLGQSGELGSPVGNATEDFNHLTLKVFPDRKIEYAFTYSAKVAPVNLSIETDEEEHALLVKLPALPIGLELVLFGPEPSSVIFNEIPLPRMEAGVPSALDGDLHWNWREQEIRIHLPGPSLASTIIIQ